MIKISFTLISLFVFNIIICYGYEKVNLGVYLESLCSDSRRFINKQLKPALNALPNLFDIELVPFGNSKWTYNTSTKEVSFECQHGLQECYGNKIQSCLVTKAGNDTQLSVNFIDCMFLSKRWKKPELSGSKCANELGIDWFSLNKCAIGPYGSFIELEMANKTVSLEPKPNWIPWITIDGKHTDDIQKLAETDLQKLICDSFTQEKPYECKQKIIREAIYESYPIGRYINRIGAIEN